MMHVSRWQSRSDRMDCCSPGVHQELRVVSESTHFGIHGILEDHIKLKHEIRVVGGWTNPGWFVLSGRVSHRLHRYLRKSGPIMIFILQSLLIVSMDNNSKHEYN